MLTRRLLPPIAAAITSERLLELRRGFNEKRRRVVGAPHRVHYFHQVDDPYGYLIAQVLERFVERYDVELVPWLVGPPPDEAAPDRARLEAFAQKDAADIAPHLGLNAPRHPAPPDAVPRAQRLLAGAIAAGRFAEGARLVGRALFGDGSLDDVPFEEAAVDLAKGEAERRKLGHYLGAMFCYGGEWYWAVDRLHFLEARLQGLGLGEAQAPLIAPPAEGLSVSSDRRVEVEVFLSVRSPYSYLSIPRVLAWRERLPIELTVRPVLPMVMRGLPVPRTKRFYLLLDAAREARRQSIPFGRIADPLYEPTERVYSLYPWAESEGRGEALLESFARGAWAEGIDTGSDFGLRVVVERAGLSWEAAREHLGTDAWRAVIEANQDAMLAAGVWGVPSFVVKDGERSFVTWGQDRLWLVERKIVERCGSMSQGE